MILLEIYKGKTGDYCVYEDRILVPKCLMAEQADDYITDLIKALEMMHRLQDRLLEKRF
nr:MAG TPA: hypothetical protein [Caudoviricetes sp.]